MKNVDFQALFESAPGLYLILLPDLTIVAVSDAYLNATMTKRNEIIGRGLFDVFPDNPDDPTADGVSNLRHSLNSVLQNKASHTMAFQKYDIRRPDGSFEERYWSPVNKPVVNDQQEITYIIHRVEDVTDFLKIKNEQTNTDRLNEDLQKRISQLEVEILLRSRDLQNTNVELEKTNELFSLLFESNPTAIAISNMKDAKLVNVNNSFLNMFDFSTKKEVIGKTAAELNIIATTEVRDKVVSLLQKYGTASNIEQQITTQTGKPKWVSTSAHVVHVAEHPCLLSVTMDISERKKQEDLLIVQTDKLNLANQELESFSYSVSHDLKAPLRSLQGFSKALLENYAGKFDKDADRWLHFIEDNANRMGVLIDDILSFSRVSRAELHMNSIDMQSLVKDVFALEKNNYPSKEIRLEMGDVYSSVGDLAMLRQVWQNLISNALKYSSTKNEIEISISSKKENGFHIYSVKDNGVGFDEKYKEKLFGVFQRLHSNEEFEGTGVGLAIVNRILQKHNGWITAKSRLGEGSEFNFALPI